MLPHRTETGKDFLRSWSPLFPLYAPPLTCVRVRSMRFLFTLKINALVPLFTENTFLYCRHSQLTYGLGILFNLIKDMLFVKLKTPCSPLGGAESKCCDKAYFTSRAAFSSVFGECATEQCTEMTPTGWTRYSLHSWGMGIWKQWVIDR